VIYVLDASAMIAYLRGEAGADTVSSILSDPADQCLAHSLNLCEVYYDFHRASGESVAREAIQDLISVGVGPRDDLTFEFWQTVGALKATRRRLSLADCFAITLANSVGGSVLTSDHHEFDLPASDRLCSVTFIR
jgi:PIN domain nuclease of toxin-antitoxin system